MADDTGALAGFFDPAPAEVERMVEAVLFASAEPLTRAAIAERLPEGADVRTAIEALRERYRDRGVRLARVGEAWAFRTAPDLGFLMHREAVEEKKLSRAAIETLAIVAYHQPVTRAEIEEIRGVSASKGTFDTLLDLGWIRLGKRRESPGRPVTFVTTEGFLDHFGLETPRDLPGLKELRAAGLLDAGLEATGVEDTGPEDDASGSEGEAEECTAGVAEGTETADTAPSDAATEKTDDAAPGAPRGGAANSEG